MKKLITQNKVSTFLKKGCVNLRVCVAFFCCLIVFNSNSLASPKILKQNRQDLKKIETYLNDIKNLTADFIQNSENGTVTGKFYLSRPGKMRVEYNDQPKILITVNGSVLTYKDLELDETSNLSTNTTPASFLTRKNISFAAKDVKLVNFKKSKLLTSVTVIKKNRPEAGKFRLIFKNNPFGFIKMEVEDDFGQSTSISLKNIDFPEKLRRNLFIIKNRNLPL